MKIRTKLTALVSGVFLASCAVCGFFSVNQFVEQSIGQLAQNEKEKLEVSAWAFGQSGTKEELDQMLEQARDAYLRYQFERCYRQGYALMKGGNCLENLTDYEIIDAEALREAYCLQKVGERWLLIMRGDLEYPDGYWVMAVRDVTEAWTAARQQAVQYLAVTAATFASAMAVLAYLIGKMVSVLERLQVQADAISRGDFTGRTQVETKDELGQLSASINRMSERIEQQIEDLQLLLGAMAHETKTPVTSIMGYADSLLHVRLKPEQQEQALEAISRSAGRLDKLSGKLLQLVGLYENQELEMEPISLREMLGRCCAQLQDASARQEMELVLEGMGAEIIGDRILLEILFDNLLTNAIKAYDGPGTVRIACGADGSVRVCDQGRGIATEDLPHVCKAFYMADKSRSRRQQGSGLGLALAERIVQMHHARLSIESEPGRGTCVTVSFPVAAEPEEEKIYKTEIKR